MSSIFLYLIVLEFYKSKEICSPCTFIRIFHKTNFFLNNRPLLALVTFFYIWKTAINLAHPVYINKLLLYFFTSTNAVAKWSYCLAEIKATLKHIPTSKNINKKPFKSPGQAIRRKLKHQLHPPLSFFFFPPAVNNGRCESTFSADSINGKQSNSLRFESP